MSPDLGGVRAKIARAEHHLQRLQAELLAYVSEYPGLIIGDFHVESHAGKRGIRTNFSFKPIPASIGVTIGDVAHCLRSALDHLAWKVVQNPSSNTTFPIQDAPTNFDRFGQPSAPGVGGTAPEEVRAILAEFQPWWPSGTLSDARHPLRLLRELSNNDKHRQLTVFLVEHDLIHSGKLDLPVGAKLISRVQGVDIQEGSAEFLLTPIGEHADVEVDFRYVWRLSGRLRPIDSPTNEVIDFVVIPALQSILDLVRDEVIPRLKTNIVR